MKDNADTYHYLNYNNHASPFILLFIACCILCLNTASTRPSFASCTKDQMNSLIEGIFDPVSDSRERENQALSPKKCATPLISYAIAHKDLLATENRFILCRPTDYWDDDYYGGAPVWSYDSPGGRFRIHYTEASARHNVYGADSIIETVPAFILDLASYFDHVWTVEINDMGYFPPGLDGNRGGGNNLIDVYVLDITYYAYTSIESDFAYIVVDKDIGDLSYPSNDDPEGSAKGAMKVTAAHEFFHAIQFEYDGWYDASRSNYLSNFWWQEGTAAWMEEEVYDQVDDYLRYIPERMARPYIALDDSREFPVNFVYGNVLWSTYLSETFGSQIILDIFGMCRQLREPLARDAIEYILQGYGSGWGYAMSQYCLKNLLVDYTEGKRFISPFDYPAAIKKYVTEGEMESGYLSYVNDIEHLACNYIQMGSIQGSRDLHITVTNPSNIHEAITLLLADRGNTVPPEKDTLDLYIWPYSDMDFILKDYGSSGAYRNAYIVVINPQPAGENISYSLGVNLETPTIQSPLPVSPLQGQVLTSENGITPLNISLSVENVSHQSGTTPPGTNYLFEIYENLDGAPVYSKTVGEDPNGITRILWEHPTTKGGLYYWRSKAFITGEDKMGPWSPVSTFYLLLTDHKTEERINPEKWFRIVVTDANSPLYGCSAEGVYQGDTNQTAVIARVATPAMETTRIIPVSDWVYLGTAGLTLTSGLVTIPYTDERLYDANVSDPNTLAIYQYTQKNPFLDASFKRLASSRDHVNKTIQAPIEHFSLYVVAYAPAQGNPSVDNRDSAEAGGGGCFLSLLLK